MASPINLTIQAEDFFGVPTEFKVHGSVFADKSAFFRDGLEHGFKRGGKFRAHFYLDRETVARMINWFYTGSIEFAGERRAGDRSAALRDGFEKRAILAPGWRPRRSGKQKDIYPPPKWKNIARLYVNAVDCATPELMEETQDLLRYHLRRRYMTFGMLADECALFIGNENVEQIYAMLVTTALETSDDMEATCNDFNGYTERCYDYHLFCQVRQHAVLNKLKESQNAVQILSRWATSFGKFTYIANGDSEDSPREVNDRIADMTSKKRKDGPELETPKAKKGGADADGDGVDLSE